MDVREKLEVIAHLGDHISYKEDIGICYDSDLAKVIEDAYMELKNGVTVQEWISVKDRLPEIDTQVLCFTGSSVQLAMYEGNDKWFTNYHSYTLEGKNLFTHWMPLPEPPKEEAQQDCTYNKDGHCIGQKLMPECDAKNCDRRK